MDDKNKGGKPIAAALPGTALGIGLEIPLACHRIFAADNPKAKIGLPEIMVGIFPARAAPRDLARKLGAMAAAPCCSKVSSTTPRRPRWPASSMRSCPPRICWMPRRNGCCRRPDIVKPWDEKGYKMPGGAPYHPAGFMTFVGASAMVNGKTKARSRRRRRCSRRSTKARWCHLTPRSRSRRAGSPTC
jgi:3-hydroxyacyl-CoA dehydrogenase/enoyl-CoA hydratase/3-hydroxybutyryl-CoA epimerase